MWDCYTNDLVKSATGVCGWAGEQPITPSHVRDYFAIPKTYVPFAYAVDPHWPLATEPTTHTNCTWTAAAGAALERLYARVDEKATAFKEAYGIPLETAYVAIHESQFGVSECGSTALGQSTAPRREGARRREPPGGKGGNVDSAAHCADFPMPEPQAFEDQRSGRRCSYASAKSIAKHAWESGADEPKFTQRGLIVSALTYEVVRAEAAGFLDSVLKVAVAILSNSGPSRRLDLGHVVTAARLAEGYVGLVDDEWTGYDPYSAPPTPLGGLYNPSLSLATMERLIRASDYGVGLTFEKAALLTLHALTEQRLVDVLEVAVSLRCSTTLTRANVAYAARIV